jgi:hypothetical protein
LLAGLSPQQDPEFRAVEMICERLPTNSMVPFYVPKWSRHRTTRYVYVFDDDASDAGLSDPLRHWLSPPASFLSFGNQDTYLSYSFRLYL